MSCRCDAITVLHGSAAEAYAREHLRRDETGSERFKERFTCPDTGTAWLLDHPEKTERDPGPPRLRAEPG